jgi:PBSX family phage terminase large subunit
MNQVKDANYGDFLSNLLEEGINVGQNISNIKPIATTSFDRKGRIDNTEPVPTISSKYFDSIFSLEEFSKDEQDYFFEKVPDSAIYREYLFEESKAKGKRNSISFYEKSAKFMSNRDKVYCACGVAGSGKSRMILEKFFLLCEKYPNLNVLFTRKTRVSMNTSTLKIWEDFVVPPDHHIRKGASRQFRDSYKFENGSEIYLVGLEDSEKLLSTEWDFVYVNEAIEADEESVISLYSRLRSNNGPYNQLVLDVNPASKSHWIYKNWTSSKPKIPIVMEWYWHEDNPYFFEEAPEDVQIANVKTEEYPIFGRTQRWGRWTEPGKKYVIDILSKIEGTQRKRFFLGEWYTAEGTIYENDWKPERQIVPNFNPFTFPNADQWKLIMIWDIGWNNATVCQLWVIDPNNIRAWLFAEYYKSRVTLKDASEEVLFWMGFMYNHETKRHIKISDFECPLPDGVFCDHDAEGRATIEQTIGLKTKPALKNIVDGIDAVKTLLNPGDVSDEDLQNTVSSSGHYVIGGFSTNNSSKTVAPEDYSDQKANEEYEEMIRKIERSKTKEYSEQPYLLFMEDTLMHPPDDRLQTEKFPTRTIEEFDNYLPDKHGTGKPAPNQKDDGMDTMKMFVCTWKGIQRGKFKPKNIKLANNSFMMMLGKRIRYSIARDITQKSQIYSKSNQDEEEQFNSSRFKRQARILKGFGKAQTVSTRTRVLDAREI